jgi:hypothetical protein
MEIPTTQSFSIKKDFGLIINIHIKFYAHE